MRWQGRRGSSNIEDRRMERVRTRGVRMGRGALGGRGLPLGRMSPKVLLLILGLVVVARLFGVDLTPLLTGGSMPATTTAGNGAPLTETEKRAGKFVSVTLADTEDVWKTYFKDQLGKTYHVPKLVLFRDATTSPCGGANAATGPFYCPADGKVYLDTGFFATMQRQLGAKGDFAQAYVVAHEIGHHVEDELGILDAAQKAKRGASQSRANAISVRVELMADCLAGLWANKAQARFGSLEPGDIDEALNAASRIGDDTLQRNAGRRPMPDTFTHGTSAQRQRWFKKGYGTPTLDACDTFSAKTL